MCLTLEENPVLKSFILVFLLLSILLNHPGLQSSVTNHSHPLVSSRSTLGSVITRLRVGLPALRGRNVQVFRRRHTRWTRPPPRTRVSDSVLFLTPLPFRPWCRVAHAVAPQILQFSFGDDPLNSGEMLSVSCTIVKGDFPVNLTWTFDDTPIDSSRPDVNIIINKRVSFLSIDSVAARHAGRYKCIASNAAGSDSHTAVLSVNGISSPSTTRIYYNFFFFFSANFISGRLKGAPTIFKGRSIAVTG